jgi:tRNA pseudouridine38-40 synthase
VPEAAEPPQRPDRVKAARGGPPGGLRAKLLLEYNGAAFGGWALQPGRRTVAGELTRALETLLRAPVQLTVAGRTDAGVHALGQVCSFDAPELPPLRSLNALLPDDIGALAVEQVADDFDARRDARARSYAYRVHTRRAGPSPFALGRALWWPHAIDEAALHACAALLPGIHDFTAFTPTDTEHVRFERDVESAGWSRPDPETLVFSITADAFMRNMNRVLVGTMLEVAAGRRTVDSFAALLTGAHRRDGGPTAAAHGLYLVSVRY